jgi:ferric-dicitrate binding protein FerR (iron transport regulator)
MKTESIINLIAKIISESASETELELFNEWINKSAENKDFNERINAIWNKLSANNDEITFDEVLAKENIILKINRQQAKTKVRRIRYWISAAASILIFIGLVYVGFISDNNSTKVISYTTDKNEVLEFLLPDSSHVWLNSNSKLELTRTFNESQRKVFLYGEAYFEVRKDELKEFKVVTGKTTTKVLGTSFNLKQGEEGNIKLIVRSGKVKFYNRYGLNRNTIYTAGNKGEFTAKNKRISKTENDNINYISWKTGVISFSNTPISEVCKTLTEHYGISVNTSIDVKELSLTGTFNNEKLEDVLSTISITLDLKVNKDEDGFSLIHTLQ